MLSNLLSFLLPHFDPPIFGPIRAARLPSSLLLSSLPISDPLIYFAAYPIRFSRIMFDPLFLYSVIASRILSYHIIAYLRLYYHILSSLIMSDHRITYPLISVPLLLSSHLRSSPMFASITMSRLAHVWSQNLSSPLLSYSLISANLLSYHLAPICDHPIPAPLIHDPLMYALCWIPTGPRTCPLPPGMRASASMFTIDVFFAEIDSYPKTEVSSSRRNVHSHTF